MIAAKPFNYRKQDLKPGDEFEAKTDKHAQILVQQGNAQLVDQAAAPATTETTPKRRGRPPGARAKTGTQVGATRVPTTGTRRRYTRRDLTAEK